MKTKIIQLPIGELRLLELNARFMRHETFQRLVENVRRDGKLTSVPFACRDDDGSWLVLSGNHRVKAAEQAGLKRIDVMVAEEPLSEKQRIAIQLSHNALAGEDDPAILKQLYDQLDDVDLRAYSGLDDSTLGLLDKVEIGSLTETNLDFLLVAIVFLPAEAERAAGLLEEARALVTGDKTWLARYEEYDRLFDALADAGAAYDIKNQASAFGVLLDMFDAHKKDLRPGWLAEDGEAKKRGSGRGVPVSSVLGSDRIPAKTAALLTRALERMAGRGEIPTDELWLGLERLAAAVE